MNKNTIILIVVTLIVAAGAYWFFFTDTGNEPPLTTTTTSNEVQTRFQILVGQLQPITFNTSIFTDPRFNSLVDLETPITPENSGRIDPFAPVPGIIGK